MGEEERAAAFRQQCATRTAARQEMVSVTLAGDPAAAAAVKAAWSPLLPSPTDAWDCLPEPEPSRPAWLGRIPAGIELPEYLKRNHRP